MGVSYQDHVGRTETHTDVVAPHLLRGLAASLGRDTPDRLGPDGHPKRGGLLPPVHDLPRRMSAGGRLRFMAPLHPGDTVRRTSTILSVNEKQGGSGRLVFVTVGHGPSTRKGGPACRPRSRLRNIPRRMA